MGHCMAGCGRKTTGQGEVLGLTPPPGPLPHPTTDSLVS